MLEERKLNGDARRLLRTADIAAERVAALVRMGAALALLLLLTVVVGDLSESSASLRERISVAQVTLAMFLASGALAWGVIRFGRWSPLLGFVTSTMDLTFILGNIHHNLALDSLSRDFISMPPAGWGLPIILAASALRLRPGLQTYVSITGILGLVAIYLASPPLDGVRLPLANAFSPMLGMETNVVRFTMLTITAGVLILTTIRARMLLVRAVSESWRRRSLTRFLPAEIAGMLRGDTLPGGSRHPASVMFIDMRDSTALAERMPPERLGALMTGFRTRIAETVKAHGGMIDKYIGDGALVLFGVPEPRPGDARRALACAVALQAELSAWSATACEPGEEVGVGIGLHHGQVYFGVIGDPDRLEATVLGDSVNVAARLEKQTRDITGASAIVSGETVDAAEWDRDDPRLRPLGRTRLRGRDAEIDLFAIRSVEAPSGRPGVGRPLTASDAA